MTDVMSPADADRALKARHRSMWAMGDYNAVATEVIPALGPVLVDAIDVKPGERVLDIAAGSGNASLPAARAGAQVIASDLTPELLELGRRQAESEGLGIDWQEADAEALPFADGEFDVAMSVRRDHVRAAPPGQRRRAGSRDAIRRSDRPHQLDSRGFHRPDVRHDEAVRPAAASRCPATAPVGP